MAKLGWGTKLACPNCGVRFYDLRRPSVVCPRCDTPYSGEIELKPKRKPKRPRVPAEAAKQVAEAVAIAAAAKPTMELRASAEGGNKEVDEADLEGIGDIEDAGRSKVEDLIEDPSELGHDDDDVAGVINHVDGKGEA